jgi:peptidoglycan/LPS O-acetylase OafA/YrhL
MAGLIDSYIASLEREFDFDPALARRLASEVEDHLREAAEADPSWPSSEAERRALERFGLARDIAAQFAADAIDRQVKRAWGTLLITVLVTLVAMRLRIILFDSSTAPTLAPLIDRYAFLAAVGVAGIGWIASRRSLLPLTLCLIGLAASITAGFVRAEVFTGAAPLVVLLPALCEVALMVLLSFHVVRLGQQLARTTAPRRLSR